MSGRKRSRNPQDNETEDTTPVKRTRHNLETESSYSSNSNTNIPSVNEASPALPSHSPDVQVFVIVGHDATIFRVNKTTICGSSEFFNTAINRMMAEGNNGLRLESTEPVVFALFMDCLNFGAIPFNLSHSPLSDMQRFDLVGDLYAFANFVMCDSIKEMAINFIQGLEWNERMREG